MDDNQLKQMLSQKKQNPRLKKNPLNLGTKFISFAQGNAQKQIPQALNHASIMLVLFGAGFCNITRPFIKELRKHYSEINLEAKNIQIIFVSLDKNKKDYDNIVKDMPWIGVHFDDQRVKQLKDFYNVSSIPELILLSKQGQILSKNCRNDIYNMGEDDAYQKWKQIKESKQ